MNPCAPTFVPTGFSDDEFSSEESSVSSSMEARHSEQDVRSPKARSRSGTLPSITFDPDKYDSMFPTLRTANPVNPHIIRSPGLAKKQPAKKSRENSSEAGHFLPPSDKRLSSSYQTDAEYEDEDDEEEEEEYSDEPAVEYLKPTVYTPKKSLEYLKPTVFTPPTSSRNAFKRSETKRSTRSRNTIAKLRSPRRAWRPPTPHPEGKPRGSRGGRRTPTPAPQVVQQTGYLAPVAHPPAEYHYYDQRAPYPVMQPIAPYAPLMGQPMMSYSPVPWQMPSILWQNSVPQLQNVDSSRKDRELLGAVCGDDAKKVKLEKTLRGVAEYTKKTGFIPTRQAQSAQDSPSVARSAKINLKREVPSENQKKAEDKDQTPANPPQNAPKGPSSLRQLKQSFSATVKQTLNLVGSESGAWSQSKRWTSFATKERQAFQKMMSSLRYMSADKSPFVPQSPAELTAFKAALAESKTRKLDQEVQQRVAKSNAKTADDADENSVETVMKFLGGKKFIDHLSPLFAASNCFNEALVKPPFAAEWPSLAELKEEGDKRSIRQGRCLPLPRMDIVALKHCDQNDEACNADGAVRWDKKLVQVGSRYICPVTQEESSTIPGVELQSEDAPFLVAALLKDIDALEVEVSDTDEKDKKKKKEKAESKKDAEKNAEKKEISK
ncbi:hypothetical protein KAF25_006285 [Fusarium avenaceum]|uniref:Uncharacterized protein n=1 Tax=Fusarium avenaceum TaxID=40199 RepID=A0A9P7HDL9_9HYPO|nr:hypothetical protein KAF25_006285 [Fusarium avenaceum]